MKILVTGGAGFIGSNIVDRLLRDGHDVVVVDNLSTGTLENVPDTVRWYEMDIRDPNMAQVFEKENPEIICHHAAQLDVRVSMRDPLFDAEVNILGSVRLMDLCVRHHVRKLVFASTGGAIYGEGYIPASENDVPKPISGYGVAKLTVEQYLYCFHVNHGLDYVALRYSNVYGPRQNAHGEAGVVAIFSYKMLARQPVMIYGDGEQTRDFVYVGDVVEANIQAVQRDTVGSFNNGTGIESSINVLYERLAGIMNIAEPPVYEPAKLGEQQRSVLDCAQARSVLHWTPAVDLSAGLEQTVEFFRTKSEG